MGNPSRTFTIDAENCAQALARGMAVAHPFGNIYAITARADAATVERVNAMKGRPASQVGSITGPSSTIADSLDLTRLPDGLTRRCVLQLVTAFLRLGPFGFRGPAAAHIPAHLVFPDDDLSTAQVIAPGYACPANEIFRRSIQLTAEGLLYVTSANRSRHLTGADDSPAHWLAAGLHTDFAGEADLLIVEHPDEVGARERYPRHHPVSTTVLAFHRVVRIPGDRRPCLVLERHGSLHQDDVRAILDNYGLGMVLGPRAAVRLSPRTYPRRLGNHDLAAGDTVHRRPKESTRPSN